MDGKLPVQSFWVSFHHLPPSTALRHPRSCRALLRGASLSVLTWGTILPPVLGSPFLRHSEGPRSLSVGPCQSWTLFPPFSLFNQTLSGCMEQWGLMQVPWHLGPPSLPMNYPRGHLRPFFTLASPSHSLEQDTVPGMVITGCLLKYLGGKPPNAENCSQFSPSPASSGTFPADGGSRSTPLDGHQEASAEASQEAFLAGGLA